MNSLGKHSHVSDKRFSNVYFTKDISWVLEIMSYSL